MIAALSIMLAQTCATVLPKPDIEIEWLRNGKAYAREVLIETSNTTRTYRRTLANGTKSVRTLSCSNGTGGVVLTESVNSERWVRLPMSLKTGQSRVLDDITVRRVRPPVNAATNAFWFLVAADAARIYGVREGIGIVELRMQSPAGTVDVFRAFAREAEAPAPEMTGLPPEVEEELLRLQAENRALQDTVNELRLELRRQSADSADNGTIPIAAPVDINLLKFTGVDEYIRVNNYPAAIALLVRTRNELAEYNRVTGTVHPATPRVASKLDEVVRACLRINGRQPSMCTVR